MAECDRNLVHVAESLDIRDPGSVQHALLARASQLTFSPSPGASDAEDGTRATTPTLRSPSSPSRSRSRTPLMPHTTHYSNFQALQSASMSPRRSSSPFARSRDSSAEPSANSSRRSSYIGSSILGNRPLAPGASQLVRLETELLVLQGEVNFQTYLKQLHLAHMGTLHREKVLDSGAEAERQSLVRSPPLSHRPVLAPSPPVGLGSTVPSAPCAVSSSRRSRAWTSSATRRLSPRPTGSRTSTSSARSSRRSASCA